MRGFTLLILVTMSVTSAYELGNPMNQGISGLAGNGITDILASRGTLWFGTGYGLSFTADDGLSFTSLGASHGLGRGSVSALYVGGDTVIVATASDTLIESSGGELIYGSGLSLSLDGGLTWEYQSQPPPGFTPVQNVTYDIAVLEGTVWIVSFGGGLLKSEDGLRTWEVVTPDTLIFDPGGNLNHRAFACCAVDGVLWVGTAGGINKSTDNGATWTNFSYNSQEYSISGNFIVAMAGQPLGEEQIIWAATWKAEGEDEFYAVSKSANNGATWETVLHDQKAHNFAFDDSVVYVAADAGLYKSVDLGRTWYLFPPIRDSVTGDVVYTTEAYSVYARDGVVWVGTADGLARTRDNGYTWEVFRAFRSTAAKGSPRTYAYPNPFSPTRHNLLNGEGHVRLQYNTLNSTRVTIRIYDFAMDLVTTVVENHPRPGKGDYSEVWEGRNDYGDYVANGVYFYSVELEGDGTYWGKVMIVN